MVSSSSHAPNLADFWAKSTGESIGKHTLRVLDNLHQLRDRNPNLDQVSDSPSFWSRAALAVCLHDLGKCCSGFQAVVHGQQRFSHRHEVLSAIFVRWILGDFSEDAKWVAAAVLTHHRDWPEIDQLYPPGEFDSADGVEPLLPQMPDTFFCIAERIAREEIWPDLTRRWRIPEAWTHAASREWIPREPAKELRFVFTLAQSLIRDNEQLGMTPRMLEGTLIRGAIILSDHSGSAWEDLRILRGLEEPESARAGLGIPSSDDLYSHQAQVAEREGNAVLIAPTGSGKTEAALLWASRQSAGTDAQPVMYYLLPYQASLNAMYQRLAKVFSEESIALQHSRAVQSLYRQLLEKEYAAEQAQRVAKRERNLTSLYVKPLRVSTPYQLLKGAFQLKGHEALWTASTNALFVLDEIHVYETARLAILLATVQHLCVNLGGRALVMSATLPSYLLSVLTGLLPKASVVRADANTLKKFRRHEVHLLDEDLLNGRIAESACADANDGMAVLIVATTVGRAQEIWRKLRGRPNCELLHGRFHADDRSKKEQVLLAKRAVGSSSPARGVILVATQVVEVSLNVDFDVLYSDPAPLEALLQRFGRVNRERRHSVRTVNVCRVIPEGSPVYPEFLVRRALQVLEPWNRKPLDEERIQTLLDEIYCGELGTQLASDLERGIQRFSKDVISTCRPFSSDEKIEELFEEMFDGYEVLPKSLRDDYERLLEEAPLLAPGLLIPITRGQYFSLRSRRRLQRSDKVMIADCPYSEMGLEVDGPSVQDGI